MLRALRKEEREVAPILPELGRLTFDEASRELAFDPPETADDSDFPSAGFSGIDGGCSLDERLEDLLAFV